jgi:teichuronic acid biosynthesis glycosyltransferase TuaG
MTEEQYQDGLVSVITPVYNAEKFISKTLDSVLAQTYENFEHILVDDCSTDSSAEIIGEYAQHDARVKYVKLEKNSGAAAARNKALSLAEGRYVAFVDSDDEWKKDKLARQIELMREKGYGFTYTAIEMIDEEGKVVKSKRPVAPVVDYNYLLSNTVIACSSVVIDRSVSGPFLMPDVRKGQDFATWLSLLRGGMKAYGIDEALVRYRLVQGSISSNKFGALKRTWHIYRDVEHIGFFKSARHFSLYALHALKKYLG